MIPKFKTSRSLIRGVLPLALITLSGASLGADFPERIAAEARSLSAGVGADEVPLLQRLPGPGREPVAKKLMQQWSESNDVVNTRGPFTQSSGRDRVEVIGEEGWFLQVYQDGSKIRYRNYSYVENNPHLAHPVEARLSQEDLATRGRQFIATQLADIVNLKPGEDLVPSFTEYEIGGGGSVQAGAPLDPEMVHSAVVVFTRSVHGLSVIGPGSKVAVVLAGDGTVVGFDSDWPEYKLTGRTQRVLPLPALKARMQQVASLDTDQPDVTMKHFDCGIVDLGARKQEPNALVQTGCLVQASQRQIVDNEIHARDAGSGHITVAYLDYIPAGEQVEPNSQWPQVQQVLAGVPVQPRQTIPEDGPVSP